jgi:hypothetical protein
MHVGVSRDRRFGGDHAQHSQGQVDSCACTPGIWSVKTKKSDFLCLSSFAPDTAHVKGIWLWPQVNNAITGIVCKQNPIDDAQTEADRWSTNLVAEAVSAIE